MKELRRDARLTSLAAAEATAYGNYERWESGATRVGAQHLDAIADELNGRPRQTLGWMKPSEAFDQLIAITT